jgi:hypothetical protein
MQEVHALTSEVQITFHDAVTAALGDRVTARTAIDNPKAFADNLLHHWFTKHGSATLFLFKKNLRVTNVQFAELLALVRTELRSSGHDIAGEVQFASSHEFKRTVTEIAGALGDLSPSTFADTLTDLYARLLDRMVVVRCFYSSAVVFLPPHLTISLPTLVARAGYVHSAGTAVYVRRMDKAHPEEFRRAIKRHLDATVGRGQRLTFIPFSHEDHSSHDRHVEADLRSGLDDVKIHVEKLFVGQERLVSFLRTLGREEERLSIPRPGNFRETEAEARSRPGVLSDRTLWLIGDRGTNPTNWRYPADYRYFICYEQKFRNEDPFHIFDESKPAWTAPITIPHTLAGAMINLSRPAWPHSGTVRLCDPFVGSGTVLLEALKNPEVIPVCSDASRITPLLVTDNTSFFNIPEDKAAQVQQRLSELADWLSSTDTTLRSKQLKDDLAAFERAKESFRPLAGPALENMEDVTFTDDVVASLRKVSHRFERLMFYLVVRTTILNAAAYLRRAERDDVQLYDDAWKRAFVKQLQYLAHELGQLRQLRGREVETHTSPHDSIRLFQGQYSISAATLWTDAKQSMVEVRDVRKLPPRSVDVIVTDPPYGFNTDEKPEKLARLYSDFIPVLIAALSDYGQLIMCLPDFAFNGRRMFFFTQADLVIQQVLRAAEDEHLNVMVPSYSVPQPTGLFKPPFYWESERALRRAILHFRFQRRPASSG